MLELKCPICKSIRVRRGYRATPLWSKLIFRFNLLCDNCNWQFAAYGLPWNIPTKSTKTSRSRVASTPIAKEEIDLVSSSVLMEKIPQGSIKDAKTQEKLAQDIQGEFDSNASISEPKEVEAVIISNNKPKKKKSKSKSKTRKISTNLS